MEVQLAVDGKEIFRLGGGKIDHIIAARRAHDRVEQLHLALDLGKIDQRGAPGKGGAERAFGVVCIDDEGIALLKQQIIDQHARQKCFSIAVPVGADDVDRWLVGQSSAVSN